MSGAISPFESYSTQIASGEERSPPPQSASDNPESSDNEQDESESESSGISDAPPSIDELHDEHADSDDEAWVLRHLFQELHTSSSSRSEEIQKNMKHPRSGNEFYDDENIRSAGQTFETPAERVSCPCCFVTLSLQCQQHERHEGQFRAVFVRNCRIAKSLTARVTGGSNTGLTDVECSVCGTRVGIHERNGVYHFCNVIY